MGCCTAYSRSFKNNQKASSFWENHFDYQQSHDVRSEGNRKTTPKNGVEDKISGHNQLQLCNRDVAEGKKSQKSICIRPRPCRRFERTGDKNNGQTSCEICC